MGLYNELTLQDSQYIPQYAGLPLDAIRDTANTLSERHYQNLARMDQLDLLARQQKTQVLPGDQWYVDQQIGNIRKGLDELAKTGAENSTAKISAMVNQYMGDQNILTSLQRAGEVNKEIEAENALRAAGKTPVRRVGAREQYQAGIIDRGTGKIGDNYMSPYQSTAEAFIAPVPEMEEIWKQVNPDGWFKDLAPVEASKLSKLIGSGAISANMDVPLFFKTLKGQGISSDKISRMLDNAMSSYKNQASYRQQTGTIGKSDTEIKQELLKHGLLRTFSQVDGHVYSNPIADNVMKAYFSGTAGGNQEYLPAETLENDFTYNPDKMHPDYQPSLLEQSAKGAADYNAMTVGPTGAMTGRTATPLTGPDVAKVKQNKDFYEDAIAAAEIAGVPLETDQTKWTKEDYTKAVQLTKDYQEMVKTQVVSPYRTRYEPDVAKERSQIARDNITGRKFFDLNTGEIVSTVDNKNRLTDDFKGIVGGDDTKLRAIGKVSAQNPYLRQAGPDFANAEVVQVWDAGEDKFRLALMTPSATELESASGNVARNTGIIYSAVSAKPGKWAKFTPSIHGAGAKVTTKGEVEARQLAGAQLANTIKDAPAEVQAQATRTGIIEAKIDGQIMHFFGPEHLSNYLLTH
jgi:hypothetical protein